MGSTGSFMAMALTKEHLGSEVADFLEKKEFTSDEIDKFFNDPNLVAVREWLNSLKGTPEEVIHRSGQFVQAAHRAKFPWDRYRTARKDLSDKVPSLLIRAVYSSQKYGAQSDYLRAFVAGLIECDFPIKTRLAQKHIAKTASVFLGGIKISPSNVSQIIREVNNLCSEFHES